MSGVRIAYQGAPGAFSHEALLAHRPDAEPVAFESFAAAFAAVAAGRCALAFLPVENSIAGPVPEVAERLRRPGLRTLAEHAWPVRMQLMANPGAALDELEAVASHPMALKQCGDFLRTHRLRAEPAFDTAGAAAALAQAPDLRRGVVASRAAAGLYGLVILAEDVQDRSDNITLFRLLAREERP